MINALAHNLPVSTLTRPFRKEKNKAAAVDARAANGELHLTVPDVFGCHAAPDNAARDDTYTATLGYLP